MANKSTSPFPPLILGGRSGLGRIRVNMESFFDFSFWLAEELEDLVSTQSRNYPKLRTRSILPDRSGFERRRSQ